VLSCESRSASASERGVFVVKAPGLPEVDGILCSRELIGHLLARALGVRTPEPAVVEISPDFVVATSHELKELGLSISSGPAFGCRRLVSLANVTRLTTNAPDRLVEAARIYAVDMMIQNPDRIGRNPNCAVGPEGLVAYDFDQAFSFLYAIGQAGEPWELTKVGKMPRSHLFWEVLRAQPIDWRGILKAIEALDDGVLRAIEAVVPTAWDRGDRKDKIFRHIRTVRNNVGRFGDELKASFV
jgi:hypothetical protein